MAKMFPEEAGDCATTGEKKFFDFLKNSARPDNACLAWYCPDIDDKEPDFILYTPYSGLVIFEVKDWLSTQILEIDPKLALLRIGAAEERRKQPLAQAKEYVHALMARLGKTLPKHAGQTQNLPCPITWGAVFPHIRRDEFTTLGLQKVMDDRRIMFWDEINEHSPLATDPSGQKFAQWMKLHFPPLFPFSLQLAQLDWLRSALFPIIQIYSPRKSKPGQHDEEIKLLDQDQENFARIIGNGRNLITGPAGSGKTLVLARHAAFLGKSSTHIKRILFTCFNLSLTGYIMRLLSLKGVPLGKNGVEVLPFFKVCETILKEYFAHTGEEKDYYQLIINEALEALAGDNPIKNRWDAIIVDEGQDFSREMITVLRKLLPENGPICAALDSTQALYGHDGRAWLELPGFRKHTLKNQYRNSPSIAWLSQKVLNRDIPERKETPQSMHERDLNALTAKISEKILSLLDSGIHMNEIAVIYCRNRDAENRVVPEAVQEALESRGILSRWLAKNTESKSNFDITTDSVAISTVHSAKGLDFSHVFLLGLDLLNPASAHDRALAHVGITRAREYLNVCALANTGIAANLALL